MKNNNIEIWESVKNWEDLYEISNFGKVKSLPKEINMPNGAFAMSKEKLLTVRKYGLQNYSCGFSLDNKIYRQSVGRLVAQAFLGLDVSNKYKQVTYKDGNASNLHVDNLKIITVQEKQIRSYNQGSKKQSAVIQYDLDFKFINEFKSMTEANKITGVSHYVISSVCRGKNKTGGGFIWKFKNKPLTQKK